MNTPVVGRIYIASHPRWQSVRGKFLPNHKFELFQPMKDLSGRFHYKAGDEVGLVISKWNFRPISLENK